MDKHINLLMQLYKYHWNKVQKKHNMMRTFDDTSGKYRQFLYGLNIYNLLKD